MPLQLTTPFDPGSFDTVDYTHVKIIEFTLNTSKKFIRVLCEYGNVVDGKWVTASTLPEQVHIIADVPAHNGGTELEPIDVPAQLHFSILATALPATTSVSIYSQASGKLYQWFIDQNIYLGTIV